VPLKEGWAKVKAEAAAKAEAATAETAKAETAKSGR
jgi:hypothetical protein